MVALCWVAPLRLLLVVSLGQRCRLCCQVVGDNFEELLGVQDKRVPVLLLSQWAYADSIGGDLYKTLTTDSQWETEKTFEFIADSETLVNIISGVAVPETNDKDTTSEIIEYISEAMIRCNWGPRSFNGNPVRWRQRELNKEADYIAIFCMDTKADLDYWNKEFLANNFEKITNIQVRSDGG